MIQTFTFIARDDIALGFNNTAKSESGTHWELSPSGRIEILITAPPLSVSSALLWTLDRSDLFSNPKRPLLELIPDINAPTPAPVPTTAEVQKNPMRVPTNLLAQVPVISRIVDFEEDISSGILLLTPRGQPKLEFKDQHYSNVNATQGTVEDWIVTNPTQGTHHFHIHQLHFVLLAIDGVAVPESDVQYYDTLNVEHGTNVTVRLDFTGLIFCLPRVVYCPYMNLGENVVGTFVYHCHIMEHSDRGMMSLITVFPALSSDTTTPSMTPLVATSPSSLPSSSNIPTIASASPSTMPLSPASLLPSISVSTSQPSNVESLAPVFAPIKTPTSLPIATPVICNRSFFVSSLNPNASDSNQGTSSSAPWRSIQHLNNFGFKDLNSFPGAESSYLGFQPGDTIFLEGVNKELT